MVDDARQHDSQKYVDELEPGTTLMRGQYKIIRYLNSGGFGITYLATDSLDRQIVIKECFPQSFCRRNGQQIEARSESHVGELRSIVRLFSQEARALAKLEHPYIVGVHQVFEENNTAYMAIDFVKGHDLLAIIEQKVVLLRPDQVKAVLRKVLDAIGFVHSAGMLHRDISPDNIIITDELTPVLIDFGAAREQATKATRALSALRVVKDGYSPQEFYIAGSEQGPSSDLYSVAASFYHAITGQLPPDSQLRIASHVAKEPDPYIPLGKMTSDYDEAFCSAIDKAMAILPKDRVTSAAEWSIMMETPVKSRAKRASKQVPSISRKPKRVSHRISARPSKRVKVASKSSNLLGRVSAIAIAACIVGGVAYLTLDNPRISRATSAIFETSPSQVETVAAAETAAPAIAAQEETQVATTDPEPSEVPAADTPNDLAAQIATVASEETVDTSAGLDVVTTPALEAFVDSYVNGEVVASWALDLPFRSNSENVIVSVNDSFSNRLSSGERIVEVDGAQVYDLEDTLRQLAKRSDGKQISFRVVAENPGAGTRMYTQVTAPIIYMTDLRNGFRFQTQFDGSVWLTTVIDVAPDTNSGLKAGDTIVAMVGTNERISDGATMARLLAETITSGQSQAQLAVSRAGTMWVESIETGASS
ncbi:serine/threonine-protein kinase [uncultured Ruegeria sp.]|uniref:serine/threonine protein kinase n=1 Tax=uncultured Ruegeria sp. TaxID=259304 RepID=UPI00261CE148|nr:serine/threonine-protein kinase [uncultured Ruegeria sp.]